MSKTKEEILKALDADTPRDVIEQREGGGAKKLSYLPGWHVINELNKIFGPDAWSYDVTELRCVHSGEFPGKYGAIQSASYVATVSLYVQFPGSEQAKRITDVGFGNGTDKTDPGKPHELATKEAVTDAIKRCAKSLGMFLGLSLYTKSDEYIEDAPKAAALAPKPTPMQTVAPALATMVTMRPGEAPVSESVVFNREALNKRITAMSKVVIAKRLKTLEELKADMRSMYKVDKTAELSDLEAKSFLTLLENQANAVVTNSVAEPRGT
jgi:hypothetical protein